MRAAEGAAGLQNGLQPPCSCCPASLPQPHAMLGRNTSAMYRTNGVNPSSSRPLPGLGAPGRRRCRRPPFASRPPGGRLCACTCRAVCPAPHPSYGNTEGCSPIKAFNFLRRVLHRAAYGPRSLPEPLGCQSRRQASVGTSLPGHGGGIGKHGCWLDDIYGSSTDSHGPYASSPPQSLFFEVN